MREKQELKNRVERKIENVESCRKIDLENIVGKMR